MTFSLLDALRQAKTEPVFDHARIDRLTYAIGDIHGRQDLFIRMLERLFDDALAFDERPRLVLLGDYIDRGPASADVLESIVELQKHDWCDLVVLLGNHEYFLVKFILDCKNEIRTIKASGINCSRTCSRLFRVSICECSIMPSFRSQQATICSSMPA